MSEKTTFHATTIVCVKKDDRVALAGDGQVTLGQSTVMKHGAKKIRRLYHNKVLAGFAGSVADAFTLFEKFEGRLEESHGNLEKAAVGLAREWRTDKYLRQLEALLIVASKDKMLMISGNGEVIEPDDNIMAIGSGGMFALAAAKALVKHADLSAKEMAYEAMNIASDICVYTNKNISIEEL
ncbi:MAG: ATP-dependent protease subunit HslV [Bacillota bacterium]|jgi:ATP-dependent HslUV protease subunit HslV